jgi:hypothetical protein
MTEEQLFLAALDLPNARARNAYLDEACGNRPALRQQIEALLAAHFKSGEFLEWYKAVRLWRALSRQLNRQQNGRIVRDRLPAAKNVRQISQLGQGQRQARQQ